MRIKVTQNHIDKGRRGSSESCAIARAVKDAIPDALVVSVGFESVGVYRYRGAKTRWQSLKLPPQVRFFIDDFDAGKTVEPFEFDIG